MFHHPDDGLHVSLHKLDPCATHEAHPRPGAAAVLGGSHRMWIGFTPDPATVAARVPGTDPRHETAEPRAWHSVTPLEEC